MSGQFGREAVVDAPFPMTPFAYPVGKSQLECKESRDVQLAIREEGRSTSNNQVSSPNITFERNKLTQK